MTTRVRLAPFTKQHSGGFLARERCKVAYVAGIQSDPQNDILRVEIFGHSQVPLHFTFLTSMGREYPSCEIPYGPATPS